MTKPKKDISAIMNSVGNNAVLRTNSKAPDGFKSKSLAKVPVAFCEAYDELKSEGGTALDMSSYIIEAFREKLVRDGKLR